jgi:hypothetical protein
MMKNLVLYRIQSETKTNVDADKIQSVRLRDCLQSDNQLSKPRIEALLGISKNEKMFSFEECEQYYSVHLSCEFKAPKLLAANGAPYVPVNYPIWISKKDQWCLTQDAGRKLSSVGITLVSYSITSDPLAIAPLLLSKTGFQSIIENVARPDDGGQIRRISVENAVVDETEFKQITLGSSQLQDSSLFKEILRSAAWISTMTFVTPPLTSSDREIVCRLNDWGGVTLYTPNMLESEILEVTHSIYSSLSQILEKDLPTKQRKGRAR